MSKRLNRDDLDKMFEWGLYLPTRTVYIGSATGIDAGAAELAVKGLHILDAQSAAPITVILNTEGGDWCHGLAIYDAIRACRSPVTVRGTGSVMSAGAVIMQAGDVRILTPSATVMIHYGTDELSGHAKEVARWVAKTARDNTHMEDIFLSKMPGMSRARLQKLLNFDTILSASEAVAYGLADSVEEPPTADA